MPGQQCTLTSTFRHPADTPYISMHAEGCCEPPGRSVWAFCLCGLQETSHLSRLTAEPVTAAATSRVDVVAHYKKRICSARVMFGIKK